MKPALSSIVLFAFVALAGCASLEFENERVLKVERDESMRANKVTVSFELSHNGDVVEVLPEGSLSAYRNVGNNDFARASSESFYESEGTDIRIPVTLLLDLSSSMYHIDGKLQENEHSKAVEGLKRGASAFVKELEKDGYKVSIFEFASDIKRIPEGEEGIESIPEIFRERSVAGLRGDYQWTSLYYAIAQALEQNEEATVAVFSDGADNYSNEQYGWGLERLEKLVQGKDGVGDDRTIFAIGYDIKKEERDSANIPAVEALTRISGPKNYIPFSNVEDFQKVFKDLESRFKKIWTYDYWTPQESGVIKIEAVIDGTKGTSKELKFSTNN